MGKIKILPPQIVNLIAAGEVVERPASILKEVLENSLDAGATYIRVKTREGGKELLQIEDDGTGMGSADAHLAFTQHATSKISTVYDLQNIHSFGFRGEALASISSVADVEMHTKQEGEPATKITVSESRINTNKSPRAERGTELIISELFGHTPARRKFLKSTPTELSHLQDAFVSLALANLHVHFEFWHNGKLLHNLPQAKDLGERVFQIWANEVTDAYYDLPEARGEEAKELGAPEPIQVTGQIGKPTAARPDHKFQYIFVNNRRVNDRVVQKAVTQAYQGLIGRDQQPCYFLFITIPADQVDVNVHPRKLEVRFVDNQAVTTAIFHAVRNELLAHGHNAAKVNEPGLINTPTEPVAASVLEEGINVSTETKSEQANAPSHQEQSRLPGNQVQGKTKQVKEALYFTQNLLFSPGVEYQPVAEKPKSEKASETPRELWSTTAPAASKLEKQYTAKYSGDCLQIFDSYIVFTQGEELTVLDQSLASAQVAYEKLGSKVESKKLKQPQLVELNIGVKQAMLANVSRLETLGFEVSDFGGNTLQFTAVPSTSQYFDIRKFAESLSPETLSEATGLKQIVAQTAAVQPGNKLTLTEMRNLVGEYLGCQLAEGPAVTSPATWKLAETDLQRNLRKAK